MVYILLMISIGFLLINYYISNRDLLQPSVVFCLMNIANAFMCCVTKNSYDIDFHVNTLLVLLFGQLVFTITHFFATRTRMGARPSVNQFVANNKRKLQVITIRGYWIVLFVLFDMLVAYFMVDYVRRVASAYGGGGYSFIASVGLYNNIVKSHGDELRALGISANIIYRRGWPLSIAMAIILPGIAFNNYFAGKKLEKKLLIPAIIVFIMSFIGGSRSTGFRFLTAWLIEYIVLKRHAENSYNRGNFKLLFKLLFIMFAVVGFFSTIVQFMGRSLVMDAFQYFVAYIGGPFYNLNLFLKESHSLSEMFGQQTFRNLYSYLGSLLGIKRFVYDLNLPYRYWNGMFLGNVYTMYFMFIEDFGYWGILPLTGIIAIYYNRSYNKIRKLTTNSPVLNFRFFLYSYLFNDLIMLTFSNRFYETLLQTTSFRVFFCMFFMCLLIKRGFFSRKLTFRK